MNTELKVTEAGSRGAAQHFIKEEIQDTCFITVQGSWVLIVNFDLPKRLGYVSMSERISN
jgi:hypothetical protein